MSKHEIIFPCGCITEVYQVDDELPKVNTIPCEKHTPYKRNEHVHPIFRDIINRF